MYKVFGGRLGWVVLGSIGTIIGLVGGNLFPSVTTALDWEIARKIDTVMCKRLVIVDENENVVVGLASGDIGGQLTISDSKGTLRSSLAVASDNTVACKIYNTDQNVVASIGQNDADDGYTIIYDRNGKARHTIAMFEDTSLYSINDGEDNPTIGMVAAPPGKGHTHISVHDGDKHNVLAPKAAQTDKD